MNYLHVPTNCVETLSVCGGGIDQNEIRDWIENDDRYINYIDSINKTLIPEDPGNKGNPTNGWRSLQSFNPEDLISDACKSLEWLSIPESISLSINFARIENK